MSSKQKKKNLNTKTNVPDPKATVSSKIITSAPSVDMLDKIDGFFTRKAKLFLYISLGLTILLAGLLFDVKVGNGGDDSAYILRAYEFVHEFAFPSFQGPMYPIFLSPFVLLFGIKLILLKMLSFISLVVSIYFFYKAFYNRIPGFILAATIILVSINYFVLYYASQTYSEAFFMMLQSIFFWYFAVKFYDQKEEKTALKHYAILGLLLFLMALTKNIAFAAVLAVGAFFLVTRRWKDLLYTAGSFVVFYGGFEIIKRLIWKTNLQVSSQASSLMYKNFYNPSLGKEDLSGFINRFFDNSNLYLSKHLYKFFGFRNEYSNEFSPYLTLFTYAVLLAALIYCFRKNILMFFIGLYMMLMCVVEFIVLQAQWDQWRLIVIFYPMMLMMFFAAMYFIFRQSKLKALQFMIPLMAVIIFFLSFSVTSDHIKQQRPILSRNLKGNMLYGLTPDWVNYIQMSKWAAINMPKDKKIASRKPEISFIYSGRVFTGITKVPSVQTDTFLTRISKDTSVYMAVRLKILEQKNQMVANVLSTKLYAVVGGEFSFGDNEVENGNVICVYKLGKNDFTNFSKNLEALGVYYDVKIDTWLKGMLSKKIEFVINSPDELLEQLRKGNIKYIVLGSLRTNPYENNGSIVNTIHRYLYYIQLKYPDKLKEIHKIGNDETASLIEVDYN